MRLVVATILVLLVSTPPSFAADAPVAIRFTLTSSAITDGTLRLDVDVEVTNLTGAPLDQVVVRLESSSGDPAESVGEIAIGTIAAGATVSTSGSVSTLAQLYDGATFDTLGWRMSYLDAHGQARSRGVLGQAP